MSNLSDNELDRLSREAAESYEPDHSPLSWSRLEQKLAREMPDRPPDGFRFGRMNPYVWGPVIVLLGGLSFFFIKFNSHSKYSTQNNQTVNQPVSSSVTDDRQAGGNSIHLDSVSSSAGPIQTLNENASARNQPIASATAKQKNIQTGAARENELDKEARYAETVSVLSGKKNSGYSGKKSTESVNGDPGTNDVGKKGSVYSAKIPGSAMAASSVGAHIGLSKEMKGQLSPENVTADQSSEATPFNRNKNLVMLPDLISSGKSPGKISGNDSLMNRQAQSKIPIHQKALHLNRSLNFGFTFGPDYTNAGGIPNNQIGNNIGITIGYYLTSNLSINTGIIYSNKFYWSNPHNYFFRPPANIIPMVYTGTYAAPPPIDYINGSSNIWELPLTLRFDFAHHNKTKFFANAGLSSYFMMKQSYIYFSHTGQRQLALKVSDNQQADYWFGVADLSVGFEAEVGKGFSFQAEPFLKLPVQNMGIENLKLTSYGFFITFKYAPVLSRSKK